MGDYSTHGYGVLCAVCKAALVPDLCTCGGSHGSTYQEPSAWAAKTWPDHPCFTTGEATT